MSSLLGALRKPSVTNQPPAARQMRLNDAATIVFIAVVLVLGLFLRDGVLGASHKIDVEGLPALAIPAGWMSGAADPADAADHLVFFARNPGSPSAFDTQMSIYTRPLQDGETLAAARTAWGMRRSQELSRYRELSADAVSVLDGQPGVLVAYAYIGDPTRLVGADAPPVVADGQDLLFIDNGQLVVVSLAADAAAWEAAQPDFDIVFASLHVQEVEE